jgi:hypothetical protein
MIRPTPSGPEWDDRKVAKELVSCALPAMRMRSSAPHTVDVTLACQQHGRQLITSVAARTLGSMSGGLVTAMIAGGSAIAGGAVVAGSNCVISRRNARDVRQGGLRETLVALVSALSQLDHQLRTEPRSKRIVRVVNEQTETRFPQVDTSRDGSIADSSSRS